MTSTDNYLRKIIGPDESRAPAIDALVERGRSLVAFDMPAHGYSEGEWGLNPAAVDAVFAVKDSLIGKYRKIDSPDEAKKLGMPSPFLRLDWDFHLAPASEQKARKTIAASDAVS
jgi:pimeloyl-ACP methyl ester carboxylesterase